MALVSSVRQVPSVGVLQRAKSGSRRSASRAEATESSRSHEVLRAHRRRQVKAERPETTSRSRIGPPLLFM